MPEIELTPKERQALKARAHGLKPVVLLGNSGLSTPVMKEIDRALRGARTHQGEGAGRGPRRTRLCVRGNCRGLVRGPGSGHWEAAGALPSGARRTGRRSGARSPPRDASEVAQGAGTSGRSPERGQAAGETLGTEADDRGSTRGGARQPRHGSAPRPGRRNPSGRKAECGSRPRGTYPLKRERPSPIRRRSRRSRTRACQRARGLAPCLLRSCRSGRGRWDWKPTPDRT